MSVTVPVAAFVRWQVGELGTGYRNDWHRCDPDSPTHDCSGLACASMRAGGITDFPCLDSYQLSAEIRDSGHACSIAKARATFGYVLARGGVDRNVDPHGHFVTSLGDGRTIEAYDTARGVIFGQVDGRVWNDCGPMPDVDYARPVPPPGPTTPGEARTMGMSAKIVPGSHVQAKPPWKNRDPFVGFVKHQDLTTDAIGFNGATITNPADELNPHGATPFLGMSVYHLGVLHADVESVDDAHGALVGLAADGGTFTITALVHYL